MIKFQFNVRNRVISCFCLYDVLYILNTVDILLHRYLNTILKKVRHKKSRICFLKLGRKDDLKMIGISDASYKFNDKSVCGVFFFLANDRMTLASPLFWKSKQIKRVCHSSKDVETLTISRMVDDVIFTARQLETLLY